MRRWSSPARKCWQNCHDIEIHHLRTTETNHQQYIHLMELAHREDPADAQICFWLGRDDICGPTGMCEGIELLQRYLAVPSYNWAEERAEAMRYLARMQPEKRMVWLERARMEAPHRRETWLDLAEEYHGQSDWDEPVLCACVNGIEENAQHGKLSRRFSRLGILALL